MFKGKEKGKKKREKERKRKRNNSFGRDIRLSAQLHQSPINDEREEFEYAIYSNQHQSTLKIRIQ